MAVGKYAICPACRTEFLVRPPAVVDAPREIPTVFPVQIRTEPAAGLLYGLALTAFLVPLAWLLLKALGLKPPVFTLGLPLALALAAAGLGLGVALAKDWSFGFRVKAILMLLALAWGLAATFYFLKPEWVEAVRRDLGLPAGVWQEFRPPAAPYTVQMPGRPRPDDDELIQGWTLETYRSADKNDASFSFTVAHGRPAADLGDDAFFIAAKLGATAAANGTLLEEKPVVLQRQPGREYVFKLADQATNRFVRVYRLGTRVVVAMAEGPFLPHDAKEVKYFFNSLSLQVGK